MLLTGGASRRMGRDKTLLVVDGLAIARRSADVLARVVATAIEVGPGHSGLAATREDPPGGGPLAAIAAGRQWLRARGHDGPALVLAGDLPAVSEALLAFLVEYEAPGTVLPTVDGRVQPLLARWGARDLDGASGYLERGVRSLRHLGEQADVTLLDESLWGQVASRDTFDDVDTPEDLARHGIVP